MMYFVSSRNVMCPNMISLAIKWQIEDYVLALGALSEQLTPQTSAHFSKPVQLFECDTFMGILGL